MFVLCLRYKRVFVLPMFADFEKALLSHDVHYQNADEMRFSGCLVEKVGSVGVATARAVVTTVARRLS